MELEEAIEILNQCTNDWNELCHCVFKDADEKDYKCVGCREKALEVILNHLTKQEKMMELMVEYLNFYGVEDDICTDELSKDCNENCEQCIKQYFEKKVEENK